MSYSNLQISQLHVSNFARQLSSGAAIVDLMEDLGEALNVNPDILFLGGGNPAYIPQLEACVAQHMQQCLNDEAQRHKLFGVYQSPRGCETFLSSISSYFKETLRWDVCEKNLCVTNGSQSAFFILFNLLAGENLHGVKRKICFPMMPEYLGYADQGLEEDMFYGVKPKIIKIGEHEFQYRVDFDALTIDASTAALCVSRPTNPSSNVICDEDMERLARLASSAGIPFIVDCAYGDPFPGIIYQSSTLAWRAPYIFVMSMSKLGLPGVRTGIVVAPEPIAEALVQINTVTSLASGNLGSMLMTSLIDSGDLSRLCKDTLYPFYEARRNWTLKVLSTAFCGIKYRVHVSGGAFFLWLWFEDLPISSSQLYERLKKRKVLVMDGSHFFFGLNAGQDDAWDHAKQCIRITYCQPEDRLSQAMGIIADELHSIY